MKQLQNLKDIKKHKIEIERKENNGFTIKEINYHINSQKVKDRPSYEQLLKDLEETNWTQTGKKYSVSDNAVRKWVKKYKEEMHQ